MTGDLLKCNVLATHTIANVSETLARKLELPERYHSIGILTADSDDVTYCALDEATKAAAVEVVCPSPAIMPNVTPAHRTVTPASISTA